MRQENLLNLQGEQESCLERLVGKENVRVQQVGGADCIPRHSVQSEGRLSPSNEFSNWTPTSCRCQSTRCFQSRSCEREPRKLGPLDPNLDWSGTEQSSRFQTIEAQNSSSPMKIQDEGRASAIPFVQVKCSKKHRQSFLSSSCWSKEASPSHCYSSSISKLRGERGRCS